MQGLGRSREAVADRLLFLSALSASLILLLIVLFLFTESFTYLSGASIIDFLTGARWSPSENIYGVGVFVINSIIITLGAVLIAVPLGLSCAIYLSEMAPRGVSEFVRPAIELLAGIPSIVYGLFALVVIVSVVQFDMGNVITGKPFPTGKGILATSSILAIMILPIIISVSQDAIQAVPASFKQGSYALGATEWQTIKGVTIPSALPGITAGVILGIGRAIGETMAVVLVLGNVEQIINGIYGLAGRGEALTSVILLEMSYAPVGSMHHSALFALGLVLFVIVLMLSIVSEHLTARRNRQK